MRKRPTQFRPIPAMDGTSRSPGYPPPVVGLYCGMALLNFGGIGLNASLVFVTVRSKVLRSHCNWLIAVYAGSASLLLAGYCVKPLLLALGVNSVPLGTCFAIQAVPLFFASVATPGQLAIGVERLLAVSFPVWYKWNSKRIFIGVVAICILQALLNSFAFHSAAALNPHLQVSCAMSDLSLQPVPLLQFLVNLTMFIFAAEFACYALIWLIMVCKKSTDAAKLRQLMRSLTVLMGVSLFCFLLTELWALYLAPSLVDFSDPLNVEYFAMIPASYLYCGAYAACAPILFCLSSSRDYRNAYRKCFCSQGAAVSAVNIVPLNQNYVPRVNGGTTVGGQSRPIVV